MEQEMARSLALTRREAKAVTRQRLLDAALAILDQDGESGLTTVAITRRAGIAQSTFYVHFTDTSDLLHSLVDDLAAERRRFTRDARRAARGTNDEPAKRDTYRVPLNYLVAHPQLTRLLLTSRGDSSPVGDWSREIQRQSRAALIEDLAAAGMSIKTAKHRRQVEMIADAIIGMTEALAMGYIEARYSDLDEMVDTLMLFSMGYMTLLDEPPLP
jgi:TetR/AcrR family transcriptional regulator, fatty acid biosynthesis regulator